VLIHYEAPLSAAEAALYGAATIAPNGPPVAEVVSYAKRDLPAGHVLSEEDFYLAIPLQRGQLSCRELITGDPLVAPVFKDEPITVELFDNPYARPGFLHQTILERGIARCGPEMNVPPGRVVGGIAGDIQRPIPRVVDRGGTAEAALGAAPAE
jgi:hypothetical protein